MGAADAQIGKAMVGARINSFAMYYQAAGRNSSDGVGADHLPWGGDLFYKINLQKVALVQLLLRFELNVLLLDADVVVLRNALHYFAKCVGTSGRGVFALLVRLPQPGPPAPTDPSLCASDVSRGHDPAP